MHIPLHEIVREIGLPAALQLIEAFGGVRIYLPQPETIDHAHALAKAVGVEAARTLARKWPLSYPYLPRASSYLTRERNRRIRAEYAECSAREIALRYHLTERQVYVILAEEDLAPATRQQTLF